MQVVEPDDLEAGTCPFVSGPPEVWAAAGAVMSGALRGQDRNYWTEGGWQRALALGANRCCNHKEIHNLWIKYEERGQQDWRMVMTISSPITMACCESEHRWLARGRREKNQVNYHKLCRFLKMMWPKALKETSCKKTAVWNILSMHYSDAEGLRTQHVMSECFKAFTPQLSDEICKNGTNLTECLLEHCFTTSVLFPSHFTGFLTHKE